MFRSAAVALILSFTTPSVVPIVTNVGEARNVGLPGLVQQLNGTPTGGQSLSVTTSSGTFTNPFTAGSVILIDNEGAAKIYCGGATSGAGTVTTTTGVPITADEKFYFTLGIGQTYVACLTSAATATAKAYELQ